MSKLKNILLGTLCAFSIPMMGMAQATPSPSTQSESVEEIILTQKIDNLLEVIEKRLTVMQEVADYKWHNTEEIDRPLIEKEMIVKITETSKRLGLSEELVESVIVAQIDAGKSMMIDSFETHVKRGTKIDSTKAELRPQIEYINIELLYKLKALAPHLEEQDLNELIKQRAEIVLTGPAISDHVRSTAIAPLLK